MNWIPKKCANLDSNKENKTELERKKRDNAITGQTKMFTTSKNIYPQKEDFVKTIKKEMSLFKKGCGGPERYLEAVYQY